MVFHYFDGFGPKWIALVIASGGTLASAATYVYRGHAKSYTDELGMQDSESTLAPTTKSMKQKVSQVPQTQNDQLLGNNNTSSSEAAVAVDRASSGLPTEYTSTSDASGAEKLTSQTPTKFSYKDAADTASKAANSASKAADNAAKTFGQYAQDGVNWVAENPKTAIAFVLLGYTAQYLIRRIRAHERYEDRLRAEKRISSRPIESSSSTAAVSSSFGTTTGESSSNNNNVPSAVSEQEENDIRNLPPSSTWACKARPLHADPEFEKVVNGLDYQQIEEFTLFILPDTDLKEDADIVKRVRDELLSIAPEQGWTGQMCKREGMDAPGQDVLRFVDRHGKVQKIHGDAELAYDLLKREVSRRNGQRLTDELEKSVSKNGNEEKKNE